MLPSLSIDSAFPRRWFLHDKIVHLEMFNLLRKSLMFGVGLAYWAPPCLRFSVSLKVSITQSFWDRSPSQVSLKHISGAYYNSQRRQKLCQKEISDHSPNLQAFTLDLKLETLPLGQYVILQIHQQPSHVLLEIFGRTGHAINSIILS